MVAVAGSDPAQATRIHIKTRFRANKITGIGEVSQNTGEFIVAEERCIKEADGAIWPRSVRSILGSNPDGVILVVMVIARFV